MTFPYYNTGDTANGEVDPALLHSQIEEDQEITTPFYGVTCNGNAFELIFDSVPPAGQIAQCDAVVAAHTSLPGVQDNLVVQIKNKRDNDRLENHVTAEYPAASGNFFSCSISSQDNWAKLSTMDDRGLIVYPFVVTTKDERGSYAIIDGDDLTGIIGVVSMAVLNERTYAQGYISSVLSSASVEQAESEAAPYLDL